MAIDIEELIVALANATWDQKRRLQAAFWCGKPGFTQIPRDPELAPVLKGMTQSPNKVANLGDDLVDLGRK
jgi:hypothetical protein